MATAAHSPPDPKATPPVYRLDPNDEKVVHLPGPHTFSTCCECYVCNWRALDRDSPYSSFPDLHSPMFIPRNITKKKRAAVFYVTSPGRALFSPKIGKVDFEGYNFGPDALGWHKDPTIYNEVLRRYLTRPVAPPSIWERKLHVRLLQRIHLLVARRTSLWRHPDFPKMLDPMLTNASIWGGGADETGGKDTAESLTTQIYHDFEICDGAGTWRRFRAQYNNGQTGWSATIRDIESCRLVAVAASMGDERTLPEGNERLGTLLACLDDELMTNWIPHTDLPDARRLLPAFGSPEAALRAIPDVFPDDPDVLAYCSSTGPEPTLDGYRCCLAWCEPKGPQLSAYGHQVELLFNFAIGLIPKYWETPFDTPLKVSQDFRYKLLKTAIGGRPFLLPDSMLHRIAEVDPAIISWHHFAFVPRLTHGKNPLTAYDEK
ncbi:hypothetical protein HKX48_006756 [Thoreauomyces humboldtii]|nr:hypothetical protein HKX48_006756 [Thoreauomyces humboldtii]